MFITITSRETLLSLESERNQCLLLFFLWGEDFYVYIFTLSVCLVKDEVFRSSMFSPQFVQHREDNDSIKGDQSHKRI
jgi:hypothetical protein